MTRGVFLSQGSVLDVINDAYVPVKVDCRRLLAQDRAIFDDLERQRRALDPQRARLPANGVFIVSPAGKVVDFFHDTRLQLEMRPDTWSSVLKQVAAANHVTTTKASGAYVPETVRLARDGDLLLHIISRYAVDPSGASLDSRQASLDGVTPSDPRDFMHDYRREVLMRREAPTDEWVALEPSQWRQLLPPAGARVGDTYDVGEVRDVFLRRFCPPTHNFSLLGAMRASSMTGVVERADAGAMEVAFHGSADMSHKWWNDDDANLAVADFYGRMMVDAAQRTIVTLQLATDRATYGAADTLRVPYASILYSVPRSTSQYWAVGAAW